MLNLVIFSMLNIAVSIVPVKGILEEVGGTHFKYTVVYPVSANPHMYEPKPSDILKVKKADLFIYSGRAEPGGRRLCRMAKKCISLEKVLGIEDTTNPHIWLNPELVKRILDSMSSIFSKLEPQLSDTFKYNAEVTKEKIDSILQKVKHAEGETVLLMHGAFVPLFEVLGYKVLVVSKEPGREPRARRIKELADKIQKNRVFFGVCEAGRPCKIVHALSKKYNFKVIELNPLYRSTFTNFLSNVVQTIKNATNSSH